MRLKSSNRESFIFLGGLVILTLLLVSLSSIGKKAPKYLSAPIGVEQKTTLDFIQITLSEKSYSKLKKKRDKALAVGILEVNDDDYVPASITFNGLEFEAEIRLKGDWVDHLQGDKWSFRIKLKGDKTILGMRKFSIHHPETRGYINEWLYHKSIKKEDLIGLRYGFLEGAIHIKLENSSDFENKNLGIYAIEESFDKRTLESNNRKESVILKYSEDLWWGGVKNSIAIAEPSGLQWSNFSKSVNFPITVFSESKVLQDSMMLGYFKTGKNLLKYAGSKIAISAAYDIKKLAMHNAISNLFGASHGNAIINLRFYYNPITSKLEPIAFDGNSGFKLKKYEHFNFGKKEQKDSLYLKALIYALDKVSKPEYLDQLYNVYKADILNYGKILRNEFKVKNFAFENFEYNQTILRNEMARLMEDYRVDDIILVTEDELKATKQIELPALENWVKVRASITKTGLFYKKRNAYKVNRESISESSYTAVNGVEITNGEDYKISLVAKKGENSNHLGFRISGVYPNRVDAIFDLDKGSVKGVSQGGNFENEKASITALGNGWYKCELSGSAFAQKIRIIFGSTNEKTRSQSWESRITQKSNIYIIPSSLTVEELSN